MTEGKIVSWVKSEGGKLAKGESVVVVESDKADMDVESFYDGYLAAIVVDEGSQLRLDPPSLSSRKLRKKSPSPNRKGRLLLPLYQPSPQLAATMPRSVSSNAAAVGSAVHPASEGGKRVVASPYAKKLAKDLGVDLKGIIKPKGVTMTALLAKATALALVQLQRRQELYDGSGDDGENNKLKSYSQDPEELRKQNVKSLEEGKSKGHGDVDVNISEEELKRLKSLKKKEIKVKLEKIREVAGTEGIFLDKDDLEAEFDPEAHDKKMNEAFGEEYYGAEDVDLQFGTDGDEDEKLQIDNDAGETGYDVGSYQLVLSSYVLMKRFNNNGKSVWGSSRPDVFSRRQQPVGCRDFGNYNCRPFDDGEMENRPGEGSHHDDPVSLKLDRLLDRLDKLIAWRDKTDRRFENLEPAWSRYTEPPLGYEYGEDFDGEDFRQQKPWEMGYRQSRNQSNGYDQSVDRPPSCWDPHQRFQIAGYELPLTGTFTVSNLGMFGVDRFDAILPPGTGSIMAVGASEPSLVGTKDGRIGQKTQMQVNVTADHRVIYGADLAASWPR
ncbi:hypothetical protein SASPL_150246 [Salvia splendens]|uniref:Dihydrolipoamide acetyltransferase component of pyruvate dehydrogenase complex n=1 Tax=Salvia splendens TaxID=180675 RepID=A0A8X8W677_SALSN|nr:hypothetical protein SASPL_150246 [Salvia splendens]